MQLEEMNNKYQEDYHLNRSKRGKHYGQNPNVYQYYQNLTYDKINKERELEHRLVDEAAIQK